jgi:hypothetical protein
MATTPYQVGPGDLLRGTPTLICIVLLLAASPAFAWGTGWNGPTSDPDGDYLDNLGEFKAGTNPLNPDTDGGGAWDGWEVKYGFDPKDPKDELFDTDNDGWSNFREFFEGTYPRDPNTDNDLYPLDSTDPYPLIPHGKARSPEDPDPDAWRTQEGGETMGQGQDGPGNLPGRGDRPYQGSDMDGKFHDKWTHYWPPSYQGKDSDYDGLVEFITDL